MRRTFFEELHKAMGNDPDIWALTGDLGWGGFDKIREDFPKRFVNCGASEQAMLDIAVGLALKGKKPFVYTITSFYLRAAETISLYLSHEQIPVFLVGSGRGQDYKHDGFSHDATVAQQFLKDMDITTFYPKEKEKVPETLEMILRMNKPCFLSLKR